MSNTLMSSQSVLTWSRDAQLESPNWMINLNITKMQTLHVSMVTHTQHASQQTHKESTQICARFSSWPEIFNRLCLGFYSVASLDTDAL